MPIYKVCFDLRCAKSIDMSSKEKHFKTAGELQHLIYLGIESGYSKKGNNIQIANTKVALEKK